MEDDKPRKLRKVKEQFYFEGLEEAKKLWLDTAIFKFKILKMEQYFSDKKNLVAT